VQLTASDFQLELYLDGYELPDLDTGPDANALACEIELDLQRRLVLHAAHNQLILHTFELSSFVDQLRALEHAHSGQATLGDPRRTVRRSVRPDHPPERAPQARSMASSPTPRPPGSASS
jgi:hypothetical protein